MNLYLIVSMHVSDQLRPLLPLVKAQDFRALARFLSLLEQFGPQALTAAPELLACKNPAFRIGITGPPGAGKSTLTGQLITHFRKLGFSVAVMAVDPSSPYTKGAVLGDRIRYSEHFNDDKVFIRSLGTRGSLGGLSSSAFLMARAFDFAEFDVLLIETVGVGQTELEIVNVADFVNVVLVPESGDGIQGMKAGLLEIADLFTVNKSDRPGADSFMRELENAIHLNDDIAIVQKTVATTGEGVSELLQKFVEAKQSSAWQARRKLPERAQAEARALLRDEAERAIEPKVQSVHSVQDLLKIFVFVIAFILSSAFSPRSISGNEALAAVQLPRGMDQSDRIEALKILGFGSANKLLANPYPLGGYPGLEVGMTVEALPVGDLAKLGDSTGRLKKAQDDVVISSIVVGKGLYNDIDIFLRIVPYTVNSEISQYGGLARWTFLKLPELPLSFFATTHYAATNFSNLISTRTLGADLMSGLNVKSVSVFAGFGILSSSGRFMGGTNGVTRSREASLGDAGKYSETESVSTFHSIIGLNVGIDDINLTVQMDRTEITTFSGKLALRY